MKVMPEDQEFDLNHDGRLDAFEFGYKLDEEDREIRDMQRHPSVRRKRPLILFGIILYILVWFFSGFIVNAVGYIGKSLTYSCAKHLVWQGEYELAEERFRSILDSDYRDTRSYIMLCRAHEAFDRGNINHAHTDLRNLNFSDLTQKQEESYTAFREEVEEAFKIYIAEREKE